MPESAPCPLAVYLEAADEAPYLFARRIGVAQSTIYALLRGNGDVRWATLAIIEQETHGKVTIAELSDWLITKLKETKDDGPSGA